MSAVDVKKDVGPSRGKAKDRSMREEKKDIASRSQGREKLVHKGGKLKGTSTLGKELGQEKKKKKKKKRFHLPKGRASRFPLFNFGKRKYLTLARGGGEKKAEVLFATGEKEERGGEIGFISRT